VKDIGDDDIRKSRSNITPDSVSITRELFRQGKIDLGSTPIPERVEEK
jgi:hypothetical protein